MNNNKTITQTPAASAVLDHCPECNPRNHYAKSPFTATDQVDDIAEETLYTCDGCGARVWIAYV